MLKGNSTLNMNLAHNNPDLWTKFQPLLYNSWLGFCEQWWLNYIAVLWSTVPLNHTVHFLNHSIYYYRIIFVYQLAYYGKVKYKWNEQRVFHKEVLITSEWSGEKCQPICFRFYICWLRPNPPCFKFFSVPNSWVCD